jgi:hypothetical protein
MKKGTVERWMHMDARADLLRQIASRLVNVGTGSMFWCSHAKLLYIQYIAKISQVILMRLLIRDIVYCWVHCRTRACLAQGSMSSHHNAGLIGVLMQNTGLVSFLDKYGV